MRQVEVVREADDRLSRHVWKFVYLDSDHALVCQAWADETRPTLRHKYKVTTYYDAYRRRQDKGNIPPIPAEVVVLAVESFQDGLRVIHFGER